MHARYSRKASTVQDDASNGNKKYILKIINSMPFYVVLSDFLRFILNSSMHRDQSRKSQNENGETTSEKTGTIMNMLNTNLSLNRPEQDLGLNKKKHCWTASTCGHSHWHNGFKSSPVGQQNITLCLEEQILNNNRS